MVSDLPGKWCDECDDAIAEVILSRNLRECQVETGRIVLDWRITPECDDAGNVISILTVARDITGIKKAEEKIRHLALFAQLNPNPIIEIDLNGKIVFANIASKFALRRIGISEEEVRCFLPPDIPGILKEMQEGNVGLFCREVTVRNSVFSEQISLTPDTGRVWIYVNEIRNQSSQNLF